MLSVLSIITIIMGIAIVFNIFMRKINMPIALGYIFAGIASSSLMDYMHFSNKESASITDHFGEFGIVFLMFLIGLEFNISKIKSSFKEVVFFGILQVLLSIAAIFCISRYFLGYSFQSAFIVSSAFALSSTAIVIKFLKDTQTSRTDYGKSSIGILIMQDISVIPIMLMIGILATADGVHDNILMDTAMTLLSASLLIFLIFVTGYITRKALHLITDLDSQEIFVSFTIFIIISASTLSNFLGFTYSFGAFLSGVILSQSAFRHQIESELMHFKDLLLGIFFLSVGFKIDLSFISANISLILYIVSAIFIIKAIIIYLITVRDIGHTSALRTGLFLGEVGEFAFAILTTGLQSSLIDEHTYTLLISVTSISMVITPILFKVEPLVFRILFPDQRFGIIDESKVGEHIVIFGKNVISEKLADRLGRMEINHIIASADNRVLNKKEVNLVYLKSDNKYFNEVIRLWDARSVVINTINLEEDIKVIKRIRHYDASIPIVVRVKSILEKDTINKLGYEGVTTIDINYELITSKILEKLDLFKKEI